MESARTRYHEALALAGDLPRLRGRVEQNLGILANVQGDHAGAVAHYRRSLDAFERSGDDRGRAIVYHNLGMVSADRARWHDAERYYGLSRALARQLGDQHLEGLCLLNHAEVLVARQRYEEGRAGAEQALEIFNRLGARLDKADAYKVLGVVYRETGRPVLAESRLRAAIEQAVATGSVLSEAESSRELARLLQALGRNQEALAAARRRPSALRPARRAGGPGRRRGQGGAAGGDLHRGGPGVGAVDRVVRQLHLRPLRAGGGVRGRGRPRHGPRRQRGRPRCGWAPTCTTWARSGCPTRSSTSRARSPRRSSRSSSSTRSGASSCWRRCTSPGTSSRSSAGTTSSSDGMGYPDRLKGDEIPLERPDHLHRGRLRRAHHDPELSRRALLGGGDAADGGVPALVAAGRVSRVSGSGVVRGRGSMARPRPLTSTP